jgi:hypothetical protein
VAGLTHKQSYKDIFASHDDQDRRGVLHHRRVLRHRHRVSPTRQCASRSATTPPQEKSTC